MRLLFPWLSLKMKLYNNFIDHCRMMKEHVGQGSPYRKKKY